MKRLISILGIAGLFITVSCTKTGSLEVGDYTKVFGVDCAEMKMTEETRANIVAGDYVYWSNTDNIVYYRYDATHTVRRDAVTEPATVNGEAVTSIPIKYTTGDTEVLAYVKGSNIGAVSDYKYDYITVTNGINPTQDGKFATNLISKAVADIDGDDMLEFEHLQSFISFSLSKNDVVSGTFNKIVISEAAASPAVNVAGTSVKFSMGTGNPTIMSGGSKTVTISGTVSTGTTYYVALMPGTYSNGLRIAFYNNSNLLSYVDTKTNFKLENRHLVKLGSLELHKIIPGTLINIYPTTAAIVNKPALQMKKKIWVEFAPADVSGITWTSDPTGVVKITPGEEEDYKNGSGVTVKMKTATLTPLVEEGTCTVTATLDGGLSKSCTVEVGDFVDLGFSSGILWAWSNVEDTGSGSLKLKETCYDIGDWFMWGYITEIFPEVAYSPGGSIYNKWSGSWGGAGQLALGGRYNPTDGWNELEIDDDAAYQINSKWRTPNDADIIEFKNNTSIMAEMGPLGWTVHKATSTVNGYTDMYIYLVTGGMVITQNGSCYHQYVDAGYMSRNTNTTSQKCWGAGQSYPAYQGVTGHLYVGNPNYTNWLWYRYEGWYVRPIRKRIAEEWPRLHPTP